MATFVLIHGAGGRASFWDLVAAELQAAGHETIAMDLPCDDPSAGLSEYTDAVVDAIGDARTDLVLVGPVARWLHRAAGHRAGSGRAHRPRRPR